MHKLSRLQFAQVTAVLVVEEFDAVEFIIIYLKTGKGYWSQNSTNLSKT
jgi:hypothetical protein